MKLSEKLRSLRSMEGALRGLGRDLTQREVSEGIRRLSKGTLSQSYLSQIERGTRRHLTNHSRLLLSRFFKIHPGFLVDDPEGFHTELTSEIRVREDVLDLWLIGGAERFQSDPLISRALLKVAQHKESRRCLILLEAILDTPGLGEKLFSLLVPHSDRTLARIREDS